MKDIPLKGWAILAACALCPGLTFGFLMTAFPFWVGPWTETFDVPRSTVMLAFTAGALVTTLASPLVGRALDVLSVRTTAVIGVLLMTAGVALTAMAQSYWQVIALYATLIPMGVALSGMLPASALATRMFPQHAGLVTGIVTLGLSLGGVLIATIASRLTAELGWRNAFLVAAAGIAAVVIPLAWVAFAGPHGAPARSQPAAPVSAGPRPEASDGFSALRSPTFWVILLAVLPLMLPLAALPPNLADISKDFGLGAGAAATWVSVFSLSAAAGSLAGGWLSDRLEHDLVYGGIVAATALALAGLALAPDMVVATLLLGLLGLAGGMTMPWVAAVIARRFGPNAFARVMGMLAPFFMPATLFPIAVAWIRDTTGGYQPALVFCAVLVAVGGLTVIPLRGSRQAAPTAA